MMVVFTRKPDEFRSCKGTVVVIDNESYYDVFEGDRKIMSISKDFNVLEVLADLGFDKVVFKSDYERIYEYETLSSMVKDLKRKNDGRFGAIVAFIGIVKGFSGRRRVKRVFIDVDRSRINEIEREIQRDFGVVIKIHHNTGELKPNEEIVYIAIMAESRDLVLNSMRRAVESIKEEHSKHLREEFE